MLNKCISLFKGYSDNYPVEGTLQQVVNLIQNNALIKDHTLKHRYYMQQGRKNEADKEKAACPCFAVAVCFKDGKQRKHIVNWTSLCLVDIDHIPADQLEESLKRIQTDPHTLLAYTTISGAGIRVIFSLDNYPTGTKRKDFDLYTHLFTEANNYYARLLECKCDLQCKNATRLSGLAYDPNVYVNADATPFHFVPKEKKSPQKAPEKQLQAVVEAVANELDERGIAYTPHRRNNYIMHTGYLLNAYGVEQTSAIEWATERFSDYRGDVEGIIRSCYRQTDEHNTRSLRKKRSNKEGASKENFAGVNEIVDFLNTQARFRFNLITGKVEVTELDSVETDEYTEINDRFANSLWCRMNKEVKPVRIQDIYHVLNSEYVKPFNPFVNYFNSLKPWDGVTDYIGQLAATVHVRDNQEVFNEYFRKWFVAVVASLLDDRVVNHEILVLVGPQGCYKTTWFQHLLSPELRRYFYTKVNSDRINKDDRLSLTEFALICMEEIDALNASELAQVKAMLSMVVVNERKAYAHFKESLPHIASFCGTTNNQQFLTDPTGNRRWLPFYVDSIDNPHTHPVNYEGVYAQLFALWKGDFRYWFTNDEIVAVNERNNQFEVPNLEEELILTYFRRPMPGEERATFVSTAHILSRINASVKQILTSTKVGIAMKKLGFEAVRAGGKRGYRVVEFTQDEVHFNQKAMARYTDDGR